MWDKDMWMKYVLIVYSCVMWSSGIFPLLLYNTSRNCKRGMFFLSSPIWNLQFSRYPNFKVAFTSLQVVSFGWIGYCFCCTTQVGERSYVNNRYPDIMNYKRLWCWCSSELLLLVSGLSPHRSVSPTRIRLVWHQFPFIKAVVYGWYVSSRYSQVEAPVLMTVSNMVLLGSLWCVLILKYGDKISPLSTRMLSTVVSMVNVIVTLLLPVCYFIAAS